MLNGPSGQPRGRTGPGTPELIFVNWREMLNQVPLTELDRRSYVRAIEGYLDYCCFNGMSVGLETARGYVSDALRRGITNKQDGQTWKNGLNWYFHEGHKRGTPQPPGVPTLGQADTGNSAWESRLIERLRLKHYSWRTEQTYREWARRLEQFLPGRNLESATGEDVNGRAGCR